MDNLSVGTMGWQNKAWEGEFYPNDLPQDWQLDFYSNQFYSVMLSQANWLALTEDGIEEITDTLEGEDFAFYFRVSAPLSAVETEALTSCLSALADFKLGLLVDLGISLPALDNVSLTYVASTNQLDSSAEHENWLWEHEGRTLYGSPLGYVSSFSQDGRVQSALLRSFKASLERVGVESSGVAFIVDDETCDPQELVKFKLIGEMLGL